MTTGGTLRSPEAPARLDDVDRRIISELVDGARMSNRQLAERIGVAPSTALVRTQALVERGVITGFSADVDLTAVGRAVQALVAVRLRTKNRDEVHAFIDRISQLPAVVATFETAGAVDYLFHVALPSMPELRDWVFDHLSMAAIVDSMETTIVFTHVPGNAAMLPDN
ncbi:MAG TPA: Lrp/AsnC family transcriptional regulator [Jatrophihabitantaceae bacterium]|nr:Lrp/AsnC family transcriptional regulator [Jatrophihabitantaceae bacterium]